MIGYLAWYAPVLVPVLALAALLLWWRTTDLAARIKQLEARSGEEW